MLEALTPELLIYLIFAFLSWGYLASLLDADKKSISLEIIGITLAATIWWAWAPFVIVYRWWKG